MVWVGKERTATTAAAGGGAPAPALKATRYTRLMPSLSADTLVDELAQRAAALLFPGVSSTDIDLYLVPHEGERKPPAEAEAGAALLDEPALSLERAGIVSGSWLLVRVAMPAATADLGIAEIVSALGVLTAAVHRGTLANRKSELERLLIKPTFSVSVSSSGGTGVRSPKSEKERFALKVAVIDFYGLWDPATAGDAEANRRVFTMLPLPEAAGERTSVAFKDATLAHIWPSSQAAEADALRRLLDLPAAFHLSPRNFLILEKAAEAAFDADALLLLPVRAAPPAPPRVRARAFRLAEYRATAPNGGAAARDAVAPLAGCELSLPRAAAGGVPFLRLLAWKAISALRAGAEAADDAAAAFPPDLDVDASLTSRAGARGFNELLSVGLVFGFGSR